MLAGGAIVGSNLGIARAAHVVGSDTIRIGLVGCGTRGTAAAIQALHTTGGDVRLVAIADIFDNKVQTAYRTIKGEHPGKVAVKDSRFVGFDAFQRVMDSDAELVILATPPGFRPMQFEAAVEAGKHVFMEKPVATDAPGCVECWRRASWRERKGWPFRLVCSVITSFATRNVSTDCKMAPLAT